VPATELPSASIFDYWDPAAAVQRLLCGAAVDQMEIQVNGDFHEFHFSGLAQDVLDSSSFSSANAGELQSFPAEPALAAFDYSIVPGNMARRGWEQRPRSSSPSPAHLSFSRTNWTRGPESSDRTCRAPFLPASGA